MRSLFLALAVFSAARAQTIVHTWEKIEITLTSANSYTNPYSDVEVWVDLTGPAGSGFNQKRIWGFWDGGGIFRVRVLGTVPGIWTWTSGASLSDNGLAGKSGSFSVVAWSDAELNANPCRHGMVVASASGHALSYADRTPFFLTADTWWPAMTYRFPWRDSEMPYPMDQTAGFKDFVKYRKNQGYNSVTVLATFPVWANDGLGSSLQASDGTTVRLAWSQKGMNSAMDMHDENGQRPFLFPGRVPGLADVVPDLNRINPRYFQMMDKKMDYLNAQGFTPEIETVRRDIGPVWKKYYPWPDSYVRFIQYFYSRYQANNCLFAPIHEDLTIGLAPSDWSDAASQQHKKYGAPPFGNLVTTDIDASTLKVWGAGTNWLTCHQIGNADRFHASYSLLTDIFHAVPKAPGFNGEPTYDGRELSPGNSQANGFQCRSAMYGSVLSGGLAGHVYGAGGNGTGLHCGVIEPAAGTGERTWEQMSWATGAQMPYLKAFMLSEGSRYQDLIPDNGFLTPNKTGSPANANTMWAYATRTADQSLYMLYFEKGCGQARLLGAKANVKYASQWFDPRTGAWSSPIQISANVSGELALPTFPGNLAFSDKDWALKVSTYSSTSISSWAGTLPSGRMEIIQRGRSLIVRKTFVDKANVSLAVFTLNGKKIMDIFNGIQNAGVVDFLLDKVAYHGLPNSFIVSLTCDGRTESRKITLHFSPPR